MSNFSDRLRDARKDIGWRAEDAAEKAGVSRGTIYNWENGGGSPGDAYLRALMAERISPDWLLTGAEPMYRAPGARDLERDAAAYREVAEIVLRVERVAGTVENEIVVYRPSVHTGPEPVPEPEKRRDGSDTDENDDVTEGPAD